MYNVRRITEDCWWVGGSDRRLNLFENVYPVPAGVSYNSYMVLDEKTVLLDTVDRSISELFFENVAHVLGGRPLDYVIVNHMEPDHCATLGELLRRWPEVNIVCTAKARQMIAQFFELDADAAVTVVKEGDTLATGRHVFTFVMAPMVHWPEVMVTYDSTDKTLFSADAFGTFGAINGNLFADETALEGGLIPEARRYYANIVGKYGPQVQALLKKAAKLELARICPLHGPVWRENLDMLIDLYDKWSAYKPETKGVCIAYASVYGHTENAADILASYLAERGVRDIRMFDVSVTHPSYIVSEAFRMSHLVFAATTYNMGIFVTMENLLHDLLAHNLQNRTIALMENGSWAASSGKLMRELLSGLKNCTLLEETVSLKSALKEGQLAQLEAMADAIVRSME